ncbi:hypothetical protein GCM10027273_07230 [Nocardioides pakistanensis]
MPEAQARWHERLPARAASVRRARHLVRAAAGETTPGDLVETAELLVSELVSNAVIHAGTTIEVEVLVAAPDRIKVSVVDGSPHSPVRREYDAVAATGRGVRLLDALSGDWGVELGDSGKRVWFRLQSGPQPMPSAVATMHERTTAPPDTVTVELVNVPLPLYARWQQHAEALLREYLLATLDDADPEAQLRRHSQCSDAVALLAEAFRAAPALRTESERGGDVRTARVELTVPRESVPHFATLDRTLDVAITLADTDQLLAPSTDTDMRRLREWICREVERQAAGQPPSSWIEGELQPRQ